ncbi:MAG: transporter [Hyphomicrobiales bacterium]
MAWGRIGLAAGIAALGAAAAGGVASADQSGVSFWLPGVYASMANIAPEPGVSVPLTFYTYQGSISGSKEVPFGNDVAANLDASVYLGLIAPTFVPEQTVLGGRLAVGFMGILGSNNASALLTGPRGNEFGVSESTFSAGDVYPSVSLYWNQGVNNWRAYVTGNIPWGKYDPRSITNIGLGHGAIDWGGGYTYFNPETGHEFSVTTGITYNFENAQTDYQSGVDFHLDWGASQFLSKTTSVGVAGYFYTQFSADTWDNSTTLGQLRDKVLGDDFRSQVASIGLQGAHIFLIDNIPVYTTARGYYEFWAEDRPQGWSAYLQASIPLGMPKGSD